MSTNPPWRKVNRTLTRIVLTPLPCCRTDRGEYSQYRRRVFGTRPPIVSIHKPMSAFITVCRYQRCLDRFEPVAIVSLHRPLSSAKPTFDKNFQQSKSHRQLLRIKQSVNRPTKRRGDRQKTAKSRYSRNSFDGKPETINTLFLLSERRKPPFPCQHKEPEFHHRRHNRASNATPLISVGT